MTEALLPLGFLLVALIYSSVGFAGGSSYLLLLTMAGFSHAAAAPVALACNLIVSSLGVWNFSRSGHLKLRLVVPFAALSIPLSFWGAQFSIPKEAFYWLLGISLVLAALRLILARTEAGDSDAVPSPRLWKTGLPAGALMGLFSGVIGIGGGIFLSPFLILTRMASVKEASAAASLFIFVNSLSGFISKMGKGATLPDGFAHLALAVLCGGWIGSRLGAGRLAPAGMQRVLGGVILWVSVNLIQKAF